MGVLNQMLNIPVCMKNTSIGCQEKDVRVNPLTHKKLDNKMGMGEFNVRFTKLFIAFVVFCLVNVTAYASAPIGFASAVKGVAWAIDESGTKSKLFLKSKVYENQAILTENGAKVQLIFNDDSIFSIGQNAEVILDEFVYDPATGNGSSVVEATKGILKFVTGKIAKKDPKKVKVNTPFATIGVRGSGGIVQVQPSGQTLLSMTECCLSMNSRGGSSAPVPLTQVGTYSEVKSSSGSATPPRPTPPALLKTLTGALTGVDFKGGSDDASADQPKKSADAESNKQAQEKPQQEEKKQQPSKQQAVEKPAPKRTVAQVLSQPQAALQPLEPETVTTATDGTTKQIATGGTTSVGTDGTIQPTVHPFADRLGKGLKARPLQVVDGRAAVKFSATAYGANVENAVAVYDGQNILYETNSGIKTTALAPTAKGQHKAGGSSGVGYTYQTISGDAFYTKTAGGSFIAAGNTLVKDDIQQSGIKVYDFHAGSQLGAGDKIFDGNANISTPGNATPEGGLYVDYGKHNIVGGHVTMGAGGGIVGAVGGIDRANDGSALLEASLYELTTDNTNGDAVDVATGQLKDDPGAVFGSKGSNVDAFVLQTESLQRDNYGSGSGMDVATTERVMFTERSAPANTQPSGIDGTYNGFSAGLMVEDVAGAKNVKTMYNAGNTSMVQIATNSAGGEVQSSFNLEEAGNNYHQIEATFAAADSAYVSDDVYGANISGAKYSTASNLYWNDVKKQDGIMLSSQFVDMSNVATGYRCEDCHFAKWGVWSTAIEQDAVSGQTNNRINAINAPYVVGELTSASGIDILDSANITATYKGLVLGNVETSSGVQMQNGQFQVGVDFGTRTISGFTGNLGSYNMLQNADVTIGVGANNFGMNLDVGAGTTNGQLNGAFFGLNAEDVGGNFKFHEGGKAGAGIIAGTR